MGLMSVHVGGNFVRMGRANYLLDFFLFKDPIIFDISEHQAPERRLQKSKKKTSWLNKGGFDTVIMVNPTRGGELATRLQSVINENPGPVKIKIQEQGGIQVKTRLQKTNPGRTKGCKSEDCLACKHGRGKGGE
jgi:hypothetical protein